MADTTTDIARRIAVIDFHVRAWAAEMQANLNTLPNKYGGWDYGIFGQPRVRLAAAADTVRVIPLDAQGRPTGPSAIFQDMPSHIIAAVIRDYL